MPVRKDMQVLRVTQERKGMGDRRDMPALKGTKVRWALRVGRDR